MIPSGLWTVRVDASGRVRRSVACFIPESVSGAEVTLIAETGHVLSGRILTDAGSPVASAVLVAEYPRIVADGRVDFAEPDFAVTVSDADGRYRFDALPAALVTIRCGPPGAWSSHVWPVRVPSVASLDLRIVTRGPIEGVVRRLPDAEPVVGADVVFSVETWHTAKVIAHARTDASGRYRIPIYPGDGVLSIEVDAPDLSRDCTVVGARQPPFRLYEEGSTRIDLLARLDSPEGAAVRGVVTGPDGPVVGAEVFLRAPDGEHWMSAVRKTDALGRFWFLEAPARRLAVICSAPNLYQPGVDRLDARDGPPPDQTASWWVAADRQPSVDVQVVLAPGGRVSGRVVDDSGRPVPGADVRTRNGVGTRSRDDGTFTLVGLDEPADAVILACTPDGESEGVSATLRAGAGLDVEGVEVRLRAIVPPRVVVTGRVHRADGSAELAGTHVEFPDAWVAIDGSGAFRAELDARYCSESARFHVVIPEWGECTVDAAIPSDRGEVDVGVVEVPRYGAIQGDVLGPEGAIAGAIVRIEPKREGAEVSCRFDEDAEPPIAAVTGSDGRFRAADLPCGKFTVHASATGHVDESQDVEVDRAGAIAECAIELHRTKSLRGRVTHRGGRAAVAARVIAEDAVDSPGSVLRCAYATTDEDGLFAMEVRDGFTYTLNVSANEHADQFLPTKSGPYAPGGESIEMVVEDGAKIVGRVVESDGRPFEGAAVSADAVDVNHGHSGKARTRSDGSFDCTGLDDGPYEIAATVGLDDAVVERVLAGTEGVEIRLPSPPVIEGVLLDESRKPAPDRTLVANRVDDDRYDAAHVEALTDESGRFRFVHVGTHPVRIELQRESGRGSLRHAWPLSGGSRVESGRRDVVLQIPTSAATSIAGRVTDDDGRPFEDFVVQVPGRDMTMIHGGAHSGATFEDTGLEPGSECALVAIFGGLRWQLSVPVGTRDLVLTAGADGLHRAEFGGRAVASASVRLEFAENVASACVVDGTSRRHVATAAEQFEGFEIGDLAIGAYRVEAQLAGESVWRACRTTFVHGKVALLVVK